MKYKKSSANGTETIAQKLQRDAFELDMSLTREQVAESLRKDLKLAVIAVTEIIQVKSIFDAIVDVYYSRYEELKRERTQEKIEFPESNGEANG